MRANLFYMLHLNITRYSGSFTLDGTSDTFIYKKAEKVKKKLAISVL